MNGKWEENGREWNETWKEMRGHERQMKATWKQMEGNARNMKVLVFTCLQVLIFTHTYIHRYNYCRNNPWFNRDSGTTRHSNSGDGKLVFSEAFLMGLLFVSLDFIGFPPFLLCLREPFVWPLRVSFEKQRPKLACAIQREWQESERNTERKWKNMKEKLKQMKGTWKEMKGKLKGHKRKRKETKGKW